MPFYYSGGKEFFIVQTTIVCTCNTEWNRPLSSCVSTTTPEDVPAVCNQGSELVTISLDNVINTAIIKGRLVNIGINSRAGRGRQIPKQRVRPSLSTCRLVNSSLLGARPVDHDVKTFGVLNNLVNCLVGIAAQQGKDIGIG